MPTNVMEFRPARPRLLGLWPVAILALVFVALAGEALAAPALEPMLALAGVSLLLAAGVWINLRHRFPGKPTLRVDADGMSYRRGGREQGLAWSDISEIRFDFTLNRMLFIPTSKRAPIIMHSEMIAADGRRWALLIENYWQQQAP